MSGVSVFILAFAVSLDSFGVGLTYGLRKVRISILPLVIISLLSGLMILLAIQIGSGLLYFIPESVAQSIGGVILLLIGIWTVFHLFSQKRKASDPQQSQRNSPKSTPSDNIITIEIKRLGILIQILKTPMEADIDGSGEISLAEAGVLGLALSLDAFGAGIGAAFIGYSPLLTAGMIAVCSFFCLYFGVLFGKTFSNIHTFQKLSYLPGIMLILLGMTKIFY